MAIIYSYPLSNNVLATDIIVGTTTNVVGGRPKNQTKSFEIGDLRSFVNLSNTLDTVLQNGNSSLLNASIGELYLYDDANSAYSRVAFEDAQLNAYDYGGSKIFTVSGNESYLKFLNENGKTTTFNSLALTLDRTYNLPNKSGTVALTSDIVPVTGFVPYTGATADVILGTQSVITGSRNDVVLGPTGLEVNDDGSAPTETVTVNYDRVQVSSTANGATTVFSNGIVFPNSSFQATAFPPTGGTTVQYIRGDGTLATFPTIPTIGTWGTLNYPTWITGTPFVKMTAAGTFALDTNTYLTSVGTGVTNELTYWSGTNTLGSLTTATYPSLTELSYVKGVTSSIQTQLNAKQNTLSYTPYRYINTTQSTVTGTLTETIMATATISANTFLANDVMKFLYGVNKGVTLSGVTIRVKINTSNTLTGATTIASYSVPTTSLFALIQRNHIISNGNLLGFGFTASAITDIAQSTTASSTTTYNPANVLYLFFTMQLGNILDTANFTMGNITN